mgnify:FL=1
MILKILKLNLFQETACYKKPLALKVAETYPLPPYSTVIGMFHKILQAKPGEYFDMNISVQGEYESIFSNYQNLRMYKGKDKVTAMPRNVHQLLNVNLVIHVQAEDEVIDKIYQNMVNGEETFSLGRHEDMVRIDGIKYVKNVEQVKRDQANRNAYVPLDNLGEDMPGINYNLNTVYHITPDELRRYEKVKVKYIEEDSNILLKNVLKDEDGDYIIFYK